MKNLTMLTTFLLFMSFLIGSVTGLTDQHESNSDCKPATQALTVFQDVSAMNRRKGAGENLTELHAKHEAKGWTFSDLEIYIEDGDLEGFFVTYTHEYCRKLEAAADSTEDEG